MTSIVADQGLFGRSTTSSTTNTIGGGVKTFTLDEDINSIRVDYTVQILSSDPDCYMYGVVTAKNTTTSPAQITVAIFKYSDTAITDNDWTIQVIAGPFAGLPASATLGISTNSAAVPAVGNSLSWTTDTGKTFYDNATVFVASVVDPTAFFFATVVSYNSGTGAIKLTPNRVGGSGTLALWTISLIDVSASFLTPVGNINYTILPSDYTILLTTNLSANRILTLPLAASTPNGFSIEVLDSNTVFSGGFHITINPAVGNFVNFGSGVVMDIPYSRLKFTSDGSTNWTLDESAIGRFRGDVLIDGGLTVAGVFSSGALVGDTLNIQHNAELHGDVSVVGTADFLGNANVGGDTTLSGNLNGRDPDSFVAGPASAVSGNLASYNGTGGKTIQDSGVAYSTGTWTPTMAFNSVGTSTWAYTTRTGAYTVIGNLVFVRCTVVATPTIGTGSGAVLISLPFTVNGTLGAAGTISSMSNTWTWPVSSTMISVEALVSSATARIRAHGSVLASSNLSATNMTTGVAHTITFSLVYSL